MAFFTISTADEHIRDYSGNGASKYITKSGMYEVIIKNVIVDVTPNGSQVINLYVSYQDQPQMIYQAMRLTNNDGSPNFGQDLFMKMAVVLGAGEGTEIDDPVSVQLPVGKGGEMKECMVLEQFNDQPVIMRVQMEYSLYEGKIQERKMVKNFFDVTSHATASEIVNKVEEPGKQYETELQYAEKRSLKNDLTDEDIDEWIKNGRNGNSSKEEAKKPAGGFGPKRTFGKK